MDVKKLARFSVPGHRVTGDRSTKDLHRGIGYDHLHCVVDDHSRIAYVELHPREDADTNVATLERALRFFAELGLQPPEAVMTDNALVYRRSRRFATLLADAGIRHIRTPPYTPRWNGKAERFIQTLQNEWAYSHTWANSNNRARSLQSFIRYYNRKRPHSSIGDRPPISRIHNVRGQDDLSHLGRRRRAARRAQPNGRNLVPPTHLYPATERAVSVHARRPGRTEAAAALVSSRPSRAPAR